MLRLEIKFIIKYIIFYFMQLHIVLVVLYIDCMFVAYLIMLSGT